MSRQSFWSWFSSRNPRRRAGRKAWRPKPSFRPWLEALEDRVVPDSGGATGVLAAAGPSLVYGGGAPGGIGSGPLISRVQVNLIFVKDTNSGTLMPAALRTQVQQFFTKITTDGYIPNLLSQYHIPGFTPGNGSLGTVDVVNAAPTTTDAGFAAYDDGNLLASGQTPLQTIIQNATGDGTTAPSDGLNNLYFIFTAPGDAVTTKFGDSITTFYGYHFNFTDTNPAKQDYYAVIPDLDPNGPNLPQNFPPYNQTEFQTLTEVSAHELAESVTDPTPNTEFTDGKFGEVGDMVAGSNYTQDSYQIQYEWSQALLGAAHGNPTGAADLFINQLTPPAVTTSSGTSVPVATFTETNTALTAANFSVTVTDNSFNWTPTITGSAGHFVISAAPQSNVKAGADGTAFAGDGLTVAVHDTVTASAPESVRFAPYVVAASAPFSYTADSGSGVNNFVLTEANGNFQLSDNGLIVFTQPVAQTTSINITADPTVPGDAAANVDSSLTIDYSGGVFTNAVTFDGGPGAGTHILNVIGATLTSLVYDAKGANAGDLVVNGGPNKITFTNVQQVTDSASAGTVTLNIDPSGTIAGTVTTTFTGSGAITTATLDNSLPSFIFVIPTHALVVNGHTANDVITLTSLGTGFNSALTVNGNGGTDTVNVNTALNLGSAALDGKLQITATNINLNGLAITTNNGGVLTDGVTMTGAVTLGAAMTVTTAGSGPVVFTSTITGGANALTLVTDGSISLNGGAGSVAGTGIVTFETLALSTSIGVAGAAGALQITSADVVALGSSFTQVIIGRVTGTGILRTNAVTFTDPVLMEEGGVGGQIAINGAVVGTGAASLTFTTGSGGISLGANVATANQTATFNGAVVLATSVTANVGTSTVFFPSSLDATATGVQGLIVTGNASFGGIVGTIALNSLSVSGTTALNTSSITTSSAGGGSGDQTYTGAVTLGVDTILTTTTLTAGIMKLSGHNLTVNDSGAGNINGVISGTGSALTKQGAGTLTLGAANSYTGITTITTGTLTAGATNAVGSGSSVTDSAAFDLGGFDDTIGALAGSGTVTNSAAGTGTNALSVSGSGTFDGVIQDGASAKTALAVSGASTTLSLTHASTYSGGTTLSSGNLLVDNTTGSGTGTGIVTVSGGTLGGSGAISGAVTFNGGILSPGHSPGLISTGNLTLNSGSTYTVDLNSPYATAGSDFDQTNVTGTVTLSGATLTLVGGAVAPPAIFSIVIINNDGSDPVVGTFAGLPEGAFVTVGSLAGEITYKGGDGNDVAIVPPGALVDISITNSDGAGVTTAVPGTPITYTIVVTGDSSLTVAGAQVTDNFPAFLTGVTYTSVHTGTVIGNSGETGGAAAGNISDTVDMSAGATITYTVHATIMSSALGNLVNTASVAAGPGFTDANSANNSATDSDMLTPQVDLKVSATESIGTVVAGSGVDNLVYVVTVKNQGPSDASGVQLSEALTLPAGVSVDTHTASGSTTFAGTTWTVGALVSGASETLTVNLTVDNTAAVGTNVIADDTKVTGVVETDTDTTNNEFGETTSVARQVDLTVTKTETAASVVAGSGAGNLTYVVTVKNNGPSDSAAVNLSDVTTIESGTTIDSVTPSVGSFTPSGNAGTGTWSVGTLASGASATLTLVLTAGSSAAVGTNVIGDTASVQSIAGNETLINTGDDSASQATSVTRNVDLTVTKTETAAAVVAGSGAHNLTYVVTVKNNGPSDSATVNLSDVTTIESGVTIDSVTPSVGSFTPSGNAGTGAWSVGTLASGASATLTLVLTVGSSAAVGTNVIGDTASVQSIAGNETLINTGDDSAGQTTSVTRNVDLMVTKTESAASVMAGSGTGNVIYVVTVKNNGPSDSAAVSVSDATTIEAGVTIDSVTPSVGSFAPSGNAGTGSWNVGTLASGASATLTLVLTAGSSAAAGTNVIGDTASVQSIAGNESLINTGDDSASQTTSVTRNVDLTVTKTESAASVVAGSGAHNLTYVVTVKNNGPSDSAAVNLSDVTTIEAGVTIDSVTPSVGSFTPSGNAGTGSWNVGTLTSGASATLTLILSVGHSAAPGNDVVGDTASVLSIAGNETLINTGDDAATQKTSVTTAADLQVNKTGPAAVTINTNMTYTLTLTNNGPSDAQGVSLSDPLPSGETLVSETHPGGFTVVKPAVGSNGTVMYSIATLASGGGPATFTITVHVASNLTQGTRLNNTATGTTSTTDPTPGDSNNASTSHTTVNALADLAVGVSGPAGVIVGNNLNYTITVKNLGPANAQNVVLKDLLPNGETFVSQSQTSGSPFTLKHTGNLISDTIATLASGATATFIVTARANQTDGVNSIVTNTVTIKSDFTDPHTVNNSSKAATRVLTQLKISQAPAPASVSAGDTIVYSITVSNIGATTTAGVVIQDVLPTDTTFMGFSGALPPGYTVSGQYLTINLGSLAPGARKTISFVVRLASSTPVGTQLTNYASVFDAAHGSAVLDSSAVTTTSAPSRLT